MSTRTRPDTSTPRLLAMLFFEGTPYTSRSEKYILVTDDVRCIKQTSETKALSDMNRQRTTAYHNFFRLVILWTLRKSDPPGHWPVIVSQQAS